MSASVTTPPPESSKQNRSPRLKTANTLVAIPGVAMGGTARLLNLSTTGACVEIEGPVECGQALELKLAHPKLRVVESVPGEVMWSKGSGERTRVGVRFVNAKSADVASRPFLTAEAGSCVFEDDELVGFVVPHGKAKTAWSLFESSGKRVAVATRSDSGFEVASKTPDPKPAFQAASLHEAICRAIDVADPLTLEPAVADWRGPEDKPTKPKPAAAAPVSRPVRHRIDDDEPTAESAVEIVTFEERPKAPAPALSRTPARTATETPARTSHVPPTKKIRRPEALPRRRVPLAAALAVAALGCYVAYAIYELAFAYMH